MNDLTAGRTVADDTRQDIQHDSSIKTYSASDKGNDSLSNVSQEVRRPHIHLSSTIRALPPRNSSETENVNNLRRPVFAHGNHGDMHIHDNAETPDHLGDDRTTMHLERIVETYEGRLETFRHWPVSFLTAEALAEAMFLYTGDEDIVMCVNCGGKLSEWQSGDDPSEEHLLCFGFLCLSKV